MSDKPKLAEEAYTIELPRKYYKLRCLEVEDTKSKNGHKMFKFKLEVCPRDAGTPTEVKGICIDGLTLYSQSVVTEKALSFHNEVRSAFGLSAITNDELDTTQASAFKGLECFALCQGSSVPDKDSEGNTIIDPYTDEVKMINKREVCNFLPRKSSE